MTETATPPILALETARVALGEVLRRPRLLLLGGLGLALIEAAVAFQALAREPDALVGLMIAVLIAGHLGVAYLWIRAVLAPRGGDGPPARRAGRYVTLALAAFLVIGAAGYAALLAVGLGVNVLLGARLIGDTAGPLLAGLLALAGIGGLVWLFARMSFAFPAAAIERLGGLGASWRQTRGQGLRLGGAILLCLLPMVLAFLLAQALSLGGVRVGQGGALAFFLFRGFCRAVSTALVASAVAAAYRARGHADDPALGPAALAAADAARRPPD